MAATDLLRFLRSRGFVLTPDGALLRVAPRQALTPALRDVLATHRDELLALLLAEDHEVTWRMDAMRKQMPASGPIPFLVARDNSSTCGTCLSCGEPLLGGQAFRCTPCFQAATVVTRRLALPSPTSESGESA